ncbi:glycosyltransferase [Bacteroides helcogenes]|uniref:Glycosyl transferase family protein n=1 Tax=Bacteroides helcogenes (strain ATCC 35417 / DSM 20613 / JCM 6297 / CCUG 15421 / P 36-108) TaxID=693979 RepID=E6SW38_BACT6|nr:glycosyltransferase [Bacteroides helcogenes]ADV42563.1 glycosyl transferase family protein [Bacteroides helcogenes P 36-108]MDY5237676.1 glycosyltransferase [Bacteroides helcogenes]
MKKILFIIPYVPYPLDSGGNQAFFNMVDYLRDKMSVSVLLNPGSGIQRENVEALKKLWPNVFFYIFTKKEVECGQLTVRHPFYYKWLGKAKASLERKMRRQRIVTKSVAEDYEDIIHRKSTLYVSAFAWLDPGYLKYVSQIANLGFDIIQVEFYELISLGYLLPDNVQTVFVHHELRYIRNENEMSLFKSVTDEDRMAFSVARDFEKDALLKYKHVIVLTEIDRQKLVEFMGREDNVHASPAVVRIEDLSVSMFVPATTHRLTFVGSEDHTPNLDAVIWFCKEIAPCLRKMGFNFKFQVIGRWKGSCVMNLLTVCPEMELVGYVENLGEFARGSIALVPIRIGSGMRMKILDAISADVPFVTTSKGVEGLDFCDGEECLKADSTTDFARAIVRLSDDCELQLNMSLRAKNKLKGLYNPQQMLERRLEIYTRIN